ncbi:MAG: rhomboid family intramembrane serine protease [Oscillospiraceae bacterium]|nr:rhomboid family intramembrane serine protease [Oscillospiraceae bacterium]
MNYHNGYGPIDRFCAKHPRFGIPNLMKILVFAQIAVWLASVLGSAVGVSWLGYLTFVPYRIVYQGQLWRLVTWLVVPNSSNPFYLLLGCYFYYWIASMLERQWGTAKFNLFYLSGAVLSVVLGLILGLSQRIVYPMSLSYYLNLSIFLVLSVMFGEATVLLFFVVPVKMKWMAIVDVVLILVDSVKLFRAGIWSAALVPLASIINFFIFTWPHWSAKLGRTRYRHDPKVVNFKKVQKQAQKVRQEAQNQGYTRKCAVCGVTDAMEPDMEFRYCSKCSGYHCYCINHINNHIHIQE